MSAVPQQGMPPPPTGAGADDGCVGVDGNVRYIKYSSEEFLQGIVDLISLDLSEPYSIFTYRYFINNWPQLCFLAVTAEAEASAGPSTPRVVGCIVYKQDTHRNGAVRGYIAMLAVRLQLSLIHI